MEQFCVIAYASCAAETETEAPFRLTGQTNFPASSRFKFNGRSEAARALDLPCDWLQFGTKHDADQADAWRGQSRGCPRHGTMCNVSASPAGLFVEQSNGQ